MDDYRVQVENIQLQEGDTLLLYTDGIIEALNPQGTEQFGYDRLAELMQQNDGSPANELIQKIRQALNDFTQTTMLADDITLIACKVR